MEPFRDDNLAATLSSLRPTPRAEFAAELDERAAAGFPRRSAKNEAPLGRLVARLRAMPPRRALLSAGATALAVIAVATVLVATSESGSEELAYNNAAREPLPATSTLEATQAPTHVSPPSPAAGSAKGSSPAGSSTGDKSGSETVYEPEIPTLGNESSSAAGAGAGSVAGGGGAAALETESGINRGPKSGPYASQAHHRDVERSAEMVLGAEPADVGDDSAKVFEAVHAVNGIVLSSSTQGGPAGDAGARFDLLIPSARLSDALASFSGIAEVRSRHEATNDITAPTVGLSERLQDSNAKIEGLLKQLAGSETEAERDAVEAELRTERNRAANLRSRLSNLQRKAGFSRVSLRIETGAKSSVSDGGSWGVGDALGDAGHILAVAAGVTIVGLAILAPLVLIALLVWLGARAWVRRSRERALG